MSERAEDCGSQGPEGACCKAKGHRGAHARPAIRWSEWGGICGASGNHGVHHEPLACAHPEGHSGPRSDVLDSTCFQRTARKPWACECPGNGHENCPHTDCRQTIAAGERYVEYTLHLDTCDRALADALYEAIDGVRGTQPDKETPCSTT